MRPARCLLIAAVLAGGAAFAAEDDDQAANPIEWSGSIIGYGDYRDRSPSGPLASAAQAAPGLLPTTPSSSGRLDLTLRAQWRGFEAAASAIATRDSNGSEVAKGRLDELSHTMSLAEGLQGTLGKKVVSWDVGYAFRPNDFIQDEPRRTLVPRPLEGRPLAMLEHFGVESALSVVFAHKSPRTDDGHPVAPTENVLAMRFYRRLSSADLYGFAGYGTRSRATLGAAFSWVASDAVELHGSYRWAQRGLQAGLASAPALASTDPYAARMQAGVNQLMLGGTWTSASKVSVIAEAWYDGSAPSSAFWRAWSARSDGIPTAGPAPLIAANYGWQALQLANGPLRRTNLFARVAWTKDRWEPSLDVLYSPADKGAVITAAVTWKGDRVHMIAGIRAFRGSRQALFTQTPVRTMAYLGFTIPF